MNAIPGFLVARGRARARSRGHHFAGSARLQPCPQWLGPAFPEPPTLCRSVPADSQAMLSEQQRLYFRPLRNDKDHFAPTHSSQSYPLPGLCATGSSRTRRRFPVRLMIAPFSRPSAICGRLAAVSPACCSGADGRPSARAGPTATPARPESQQCSEVGIGRKQDALLLRRSLHEHGSVAVSSQCPRRESRPVLPL